MEVVYFWRDDSLYVSADSDFSKAYKEILGYGIHNDENVWYELIIMEEYNGRASWY